MIQTDVENKSVQTECDVANV